MLIGLSNTLATIPGIAAVAITGWLLDVTRTYAATFELTAGIAVCGALLLVMTSAGPGRQPLSEARQARAADGAPVTASGDKEDTIAKR